MADETILGTRTCAWEISSGVYTKRVNALYAPDCITLTLTIMTVMTIPRRSLLYTLLFFALAVAAIPAVINQSPIKLTLFKQHNFTSAHNLVTHDQARAQELKNRAYKGNVAIPVNTQITNQAVTYTASVGVGNPPTTCAYISCCDLWFLRATRRV